MSRKFDALVAEKVMEWRKVVHDDWPLSTKVKGYHHRIEWYRPDMTEGPGRAGAGLHCSQIPDYKGNIAAAWRVHKKACSWRFSKRRIYFEALDNIIQKRCPLSGSQRYKVAWPNALQFLEIEDFGVAALRAVGVSEETI